jgi:hypothetical protein
VMNACREEGCMPQFFGAVQESNNDNGPSHSSTKFLEDCRLCLSRPSLRFVEPIMEKLIESWPRGKPSEPNINQPAVTFPFRRDCLARLADLQFLPEDVSPKTNQSGLTSLIESPKVVLAGVVSQMGGSICPTINR